VRSLTLPWLATSALVLSLTLQMSDGFYHEPTLAWLGLALIAALLGVAGVPWPGGPRGPGATADRLAGPRVDLADGLLTLGVLISAVALTTRPVALYMADARPWAHPDLLVVVAAMTIAAIAGTAWRSPRARGHAALVLLACGLWLGAWTIRESPHPHIDVMPVHVDGFAALARGQSPYGITFTDMYKPDEGFYAPEMRDGRRILFGFPYPPLSLLMAWPGHALLGDLRYSEVLALVVAAGILAGIGRGGIGLLCAGALLLSPRVLFHLEQGWTEPFAIVLLAATVATALHRPGLAWLPLGLLIAVKQHMVLGLLFAPMLVSGTDPGRHSGVERAATRWPAPSRFRTVALLVAKAIAVAAVLTVPMALLDVDAFIRSAVLLQLREPFRLDSLSFTRGLVHLGWALDKQGALYVSLAAGSVGILLSWWRAPRTPAGFAASLGLTCLLLTAFGKKAFLNYYFLVLACLLTAIAAARAQEASASSVSSEIQPQ